MTIGIIGQGYVGTDKNIKSDLFTVSSIVSTDFNGSLSYTRTSQSHPVLGEKPNCTAEPTNPLPKIPIFCFNIT